MKLHVLAPGEERIERGLLEGGPDGGRSCVLLPTTSCRRPTLPEDGRGWVVTCRTVRWTSRPPLGNPYTSPEATAGWIASTARSPLNSPHQVGGLDRCDVAHNGEASTGYSISNSRRSGALVRVKDARATPGDRARCRGMDADLAAHAGEQAAHGGSPGARPRPWLHALGLIEPGKEVPMGALARSLFCDPSNVTGIVDRLEARGLIERRPADGDPAREDPLALAGRGRAPSLG